MGKRLTVEFPEKTNAILAELSEKEGTSKTEIIRRALALYNYLEDEIIQNKERKLVIADGENKILKEIVWTR